MLVFNIDHLDKSLSHLTQTASSQFFLASASMCEVFAQMERSDFKETAIGAKKTAEWFLLAVNSFRDLADTVKQHQWIEHEIRNVDFKQAALDVGLSSDLPMIREVNATLLRGGLSELLMSSADEIGQIANELLTTNQNLSGANLLPGIEYQRAHRLLGMWRSLVMRGQYVSSACLSAAKVSAKA